MNKEELMTLPTPQGTSHCSCLEHCFSFLIALAKSIFSTCLSVRGPVGLRLLPPKLILMLAVEEVSSISGHARHNAVKHARFASDSQTSVLTEEGATAMNRASPSEGEVEDGEAPGEGDGVTCPRRRDARVEETPVERRHEQTQQQHEREVKLQTE